MSTKKPNKGGKHVSPRKGVQLPQEWHDLAAILAARRPSPVMWYLIELIHRDAVASGVKTIPPLPWPDPKKADT